MAFDQMAGEVVENFPVPQASMAQVDEVLRRARTPRKDNPPVLMIKAHRMIQDRNDGFPKHLYHETLEPVVVMNTDQQDELTKLGYGETYIARDYPRAIYRRNMDPRYRPDAIAQKTGDSQKLEYIETRTVKTKADEERAMKEPVRDGRGPWKRSITEIEELPSAQSFQAQNQEVARLEGMVEGLKSQIAEKDTARRKTA